MSTPLDHSAAQDDLPLIPHARLARGDRALGLVEDHLGHCVTQAIEAGGPDADAKVKEASEAIARLVRS